MSLNTMKTAIYRITAKLRANFLLRIIPLAVPIEVFNPSKMHLAAFYNIFSTNFTLRLCVRDITDRFWLTSHQWPLCQLTRMLDETEEFLCKSHFKCPILIHPVVTAADFLTLLKCSVSVTVKWRVMYSSWRTWLMCHAFPILVKESDAQYQCRS